jgi:hypothetical protein
MRTGLKLLAGAAASFPLIAIGQTSWTGASSTAWTQAGNWNPMIVPDVPTNTPQTAPLHQVIIGANAQNRAATTGGNNSIEIQTLHVGVGGEVEISGASSLDVYAGGNALHVQGLIDLQPPINGNRLAIGADTTLFGGGEILIRGGSIRGVTNNLAPAVERLTNVDVLIHGSGRIGGDVTFHQSMALTNRSLIVADTAGQTLLIDAPISSGPTLNTGLMIARNGGVLSLQRTDFSAINSPIINFESVGGGGTLLGTIRAEANSRVELNFVTITRGFLDVIDNGELFLRGNVEIVDAGILNSATGIIRSGIGVNAIRSSVVNPAGGRILVDSSTLGIIGHPQTRNDGAIRISDSLSEATIALLSDFTLRGGGTVEMGNATRRAFIIGSSAAGNELFVNQDNLIRGQGTIGSNSVNLRLDNRGTISANINGKELALSVFTDASTPLINSGTILATAGGVLNVNLSGSTDPARRVQNFDGGVQGLLRAEGTGVLRLNNVFVDGGVIESSAGGTIDCRSGVTLKPAVLNLGGPLINTVGNLYIETPINVSLNGLLVNASSNTTTLGPGATSSGFALNANVQQGTIIVQSTLPIGFGLMNVAGTFDVRTRASVAEIDGTGTTRVNTGARLDAFRVGSRSIALDANAQLILTDSAFDPLPDQVSRATQVTLAAGAKFDLGTQAFIRDLTSGTTDSALLAMIQSGRAGGAWNGPGITTSAPTQNHGIGFAIAANLFTSFPQTWLGQSIDPSTSLIRYTLLGDSNLDGDVDFDDLLSLAQNYGGASKRWDHGDSNYDGAVNFDDLLSLAKNYGLMVVRDDFGNPQADFVSDWRFAQSFIPEPFAVASLAGTLSIGAGRRRRSCNHDRPGA